MRKTLTTVALVLALCCPVFAGEMNTPVAPAPPPNEPASATHEPTTGNEITNSTTTIILEVVLSLLALP
jgi:hypothetical protein